MTDWLGVALRFGVYADLLLLFGLAAYPLSAATPSRPLGGRPMIAGLAGLGVLLSALSFLQMVASMSGATIADIDRGTFDFVLFETPPGRAFLWRTAALATALAAALLRSAKIATSTFAPVTSSRPDDWTWMTARWITRWKPDVGFESSS